MSSVTHHDELQEVRRYRWTVEDFHKLTPGILDEDARVELIEGDLLEMAPIGGLHAGKLERLRRLIEQAAGDTALVFSQSPIILDTHSEPQPDIAALHPRADFYEAYHPRLADILLLVELADTSIRYDREIKIPLYARHGIPEAWLVDLQEKRLEAYRKLENGEHRHVDCYRKGKIPLGWLPDANVDLSGLF